MPIVYKKGSLFAAPRPRTLVHACNAMGVWGAGIAGQIAGIYPEAYREYKSTCERERKAGYNLVGEARMYPTHETTPGILTNTTVGTWIACLFTSRAYGPHVLPEDQILAATEKALHHLLRPRSGLKWTVDSPRFNAGLFRVEWAKTEAVLARVLAQLDPAGDITWNVWTP